MKITVNGTPREVVDQLPLLELLDELKINRQQVAVELNAQLIPREQHQARILNDGDELEIVTLVGGG